jgi:hypothetical protein
VSAAASLLFAVHPVNTEAVVSGVPTSLLVLCAVCCELCAVSCVLCAAVCCCLGGRCCWVPCQCAVCVPHALCVCLMCPVCASCAVCVPHVPCVCLMCRVQVGRSDLLGAVMSLLCLLIWARMCNGSMLGTCLPMYFLRHPLVIHECAWTHTHTSASRWWCGCALCCTVLAVGVLCKEVWRWKCCARR